jgi:hypothetical protein
MIPSDGKMLQLQKIEHRLGAKPLTLSRMMLSAMS